MPERQPTPAVDESRVLRGVAWQSRPRVLSRASAGAPVEPGATANPAGDAPVKPHADLPHPTDVLRIQQLARDEGFRAGQVAATDEDRRAGYDAGYADGAARGQADSEEAFERRIQAFSGDIAQRVERLDALLTALDTQLRDRLEDRLRAAEDDAVAVCHAAICRILGEAAIERTAAASIVRSALDQWLASRHDSGSGDKITVLLHPRDLDMTVGDTTLAQWLAARQLQGIRWQADEQIDLGGCIVSTEHGRLDARLDTQLSALRELLLSDRSAGRPQPTQEART